jgi:hypothetical protein
LQFFANTTASQLANLSTYDWPLVYVFYRLSTSGRNLSRSA